MNRRDVPLNLINYLLNHSYYSKKLDIHKDKLLEIIYYNDQLHHSLEKIISTSNFISTAQLDLKQFKYEFFIFECFFEYLFYANASFIRTSAYGNKQTI